MAAVAGAGIDDLTVTLDGPEPPILDGDALSYLTLIQKAGLEKPAGAAPGDRGAEAGQRHPERRQRQPDARPTHLL